MKTHKSRLSLWHIMERSKGSPLVSQLPKRADNIRSMEQSFCASGRWKTRRSGRKQKVSTQIKIKHLLRLMTSNHISARCWRNLGLRCSRLLWLRWGWMMHLPRVAPTLALMPQKRLQLLSISSSSPPSEKRAHSAALSDVQRFQVITVSFWVIE